MFWLRDIKKIYLIFSYRVHALVRLNFLFLNLSRTASYDSLGRRLVGDGQFLLFFIENTLVLTMGYQHISAPIFCCLLVCLSDIIHCIDQSVTALGDSRGKRLVNARQNVAKCKL